MRGRNAFLPGGTHQPEVFDRQYTVLFHMASTAEAGWGVSGEAKRHPIVCPFIFGRRLLVIPACRSTIMFKRHGLSMCDSTSNATGLHFTPCLNLPAILTQVYSRPMKNSSPLFPPEQTAADLANLAWCALIALRLAQQEGQIGLEFKHD